MISNTQQTVLIGRLCNEPKMIKEEVCSFTVQNSNYDTSGRETVSFHQLMAVKRQAELVMQYLHKGDLCCIEGVIKKQENGNDIPKRTIIVCTRITFLSKSKEDRHV
jgi:single-stranded DNA-binding protein